MASPRTRIGPNINADVPGDIGKCLDYLDYHRPTWALVMTTAKEGLNENARQIVDKMSQWGGNVTLRVYHPDNGDPWNTWTTDQMVAMAEQHMQGRAIFYEVSNEPRPGQRELVDEGVAGWYADVVYKMVSKGLGVTVPAWASGNYNYDELEWWRPLFQALVDTSQYKRLNGKRFAIFSSHGYGHALLNVHAAGEDPNIMADPGRIFQRYADLSRGTFVRPSASDVFQNRWRENWLVFRSWWVLQWIREHIVHDANWSGLSILETEDFWDDMNNIRNDEHHRFDTAVEWVDGKAGQKVSGMPTLEKYWDAVGKEVGWSGAQVLAAQLDWVEHIAPDTYEGFLLYSYTENNNWPERWAERFGIQRSSYYIDQYPVFRAKFNNKPIPEPPAPVPQPEPIPEEPTMPVDHQLEIPVLEPEIWQEGMGWFTSPGVNIRTEPNTMTSEVIGVARGGGPGFQLDPVSVGVSDAPDQWALVWFGDLKGWAHTAYFSFERFQLEGGVVEVPTNPTFPFIDSTMIWEDVVFEPGDEDAEEPEVKITVTPEMIQLTEDILDRPEYYLWSPIPGNALMRIIWLLYNAIATHNQKGVDSETRME